MTQLGFAFNANECTGCKACVIACKDEHDLPAGVKLRRVLTAETGSWDVSVEGTVAPCGIFSFSVSVSCNHCDNPVCVQACPKQALSKDPDTGAVTVDEALCIGCGSCAKACPYDAPVVVERDALACGSQGHVLIDSAQHGEAEVPAQVAKPEETDAKLKRSRRVMLKCDLCQERLTADLEPACVAACPMRCLLAGPIEELRARFGDNAGNALLPDEALTHPNLVVVPHRFDAGLTADDVTLSSMPEEYQSIPSTQRHFPLGK